MGQEKEPGEYWGEEGEERSIHSLFSDEEIDDLLSAWEIIFKEKHINYLWGAGEKSDYQEMKSHIDSGIKRVQLAVISSIILGGIVYMIKLITSSANVNM